MNSINCKDLQFDDMPSAEKFILESEIKIFSDEGDLILCYMNSPEDIKRNWNDITTRTALDFQSNLIDQVISRNLLLVFCSTEEIDVDTKKEIQSDTYCCRKIARSKVEDLERSIKDLIFYGTEKKEDVKKSSLKNIIEKEHNDVFQLMAI
ncbi:hypothetical protein [Aliivibrio fischeri]|uniref:hypothetical protein n=1 Tax=Aliivibrio fischeri TaxID=668 RepID=UPI0012D9507D|nr:hypothetical protein [Aliivibrio fischeri]MUI53378.1 hypothetical protein [Aliivibrio fischeri]